MSASVEQLPVTREFRESEKHYAAQFYPALDDQTLECATLLAVFRKEVDPNRSWYWSHLMSMAVHGGPWNTTPPPELVRRLRNLHDLTDEVPHDQTIAK